MSKNQIKVTKLEAARGQIETAIELFFTDKDPISIHTLTCAAYQILMDIGKTRGIAAVLKNPSFVQVDMQKLYLERINEAENFFKHAERDPNVVLTFQPQATELLLWDACRMYQVLAPSTNSYLMRAIMGWSFGYDEEMFNALNEGGYKEAIRELREINAFKSRGSFLKHVHDATFRQEAHNKSF